MIKPLQSLPVKVHRLQDGEPWNGHCQFSVFHDIVNPTDGSKTQGDLIGIGIIDDRGFTMFAQPSQMEFVQ